MGAKSRNPIEVMKEKGAVELQVDHVHPNRLNPNVMEGDMRVYLGKDMTALDYEPITVSPMHFFYSESPELITFPLEEAKEHYVICDGEHRWLTVQEVDLGTIWCLIEYWVERDSMAHFYKRQRIKGYLDPVKEAILFQHEITVNKRTRAEVVRDFNVPSMKYLNTRLAIIGVVEEVVDLFYTQEDHPGKLSVSHLENLSRLPTEDQVKVALMSLERNWTREDLVDEIRRIKEGRGTRQPHATIEAPGEVPGSRPTQAQRYLHPNIDRLLKPWEEDVIRNVKKAGEKGIPHLELVRTLPVSESTARRFLRSMVYTKVLDRFVMDSGGRRGRPPTAHRIHVVEEDRVEEGEPKTNDEIFKEYPEEPTVQFTDKAIQLGEAARRILQEPEGAPEVTETPESWKVPEAEEPIPTEKLPKIVTTDILSTFLDKVFKFAVAEGFDLKTKKKIDGREPNQWLTDELSEDLDSFIISMTMNDPDLRALAGLTLKACQLDYRLSGGSS